MSPFHLQILFCFLTLFADILGVEAVLCYTQTFVFFFYFSYFYFLFIQFYICLFSNTSANGFSQYSHGEIFISYWPYYSPPPYFFTAFMTDLKSYEAAFQLSLVLSNPFPFVIPIWAFFYWSLFCLTKVALNKIKITCSWEVNLLASELNSFLFDMKTNLHALECF